VAIPNQERRDVGFVGLAENLLNQDFARTPVVRDQVIAFAAFVAGAFCDVEQSVPRNRRPDTDVDEPGNVSEFRLLS